MTAAVVEVNAETDFRRPQRPVPERRPQDRGRRPGATASKPSHAAKTADGEVVSDVLTNLIATIGENMVLRRSAVLAVAKGAVSSYIHNATAPDLGRIGVLVAIEGEGDQAKIVELGRKIAMHVAATAPLSLSPDDLDQAAIEKERQIFTEQALESGKPAGVVEKMVEGRIRKFLEEVVLLKQAFVMNPDQTVEQLVAEPARNWARRSP
jgi:elongation factor Ts